MQLLAPLGRGVWGTLHTHGMPFETPTSFCRGDVAVNIHLQQVVDVILKTKTPKNRRVADPATFSKQMKRLWVSLKMSDNSKGTLDLA